MNVVPRVAAAAVVFLGAEAVVTPGVLRGQKSIALLAGDEASFVPELRTNATTPTADDSVNLVGGVKPLRIGRGGDATKKSRSGEPRNAAGTGDQVCDVTLKVTSASSKDDRCPSECPYFAQDRNDKDFCTFTCVKEEDCAKMNPATQIGDDKLGVCRSCVVDGCHKCDTSVLEDRCSECQAGFVLKDGLCHFKYAGAWMKYVGYALLAIVVVVVAWIADMQLRPCTNETGLEHGMECRERAKILMPKDEDGERKPWPLSTNLMTTPLAGTGMILHFRFQAALIIWAVFVASVWMFFAQFVDSDLWLLGTRRFGTPRMNCILVAWGYETQNALMWTKVSFLVIVYVGSVLMAFAYGVLQLRCFQETDYKTKTMKDFVAMVIGLPKIPGTKAVEDDLKAKIESLSGETVVGVSVAWDYQEFEEEVTTALRDEVLAGIPTEAPREPPAMNPVRNGFYKFEKTIFMLPDADGAEEEDGSEALRQKLRELRPEAAASEEDPMKQLLLSLHTSPRAFVVFDTQEAMEAAVEKCADGFEFEGANGLTLETLTAEPDTVQWVNFGHTSTQEKALKLAAGFGIIALACLFWAIVFYSPYAYYVMTFNYENGRQPGFIVGFAFSMIVVVGNAIMYEVCARISDWVGFRFKDNREACYMILYTIACMFNVALDFVTTYRTAELVMEGLGFRTYFGVPLEEVTEFTAKFETYGMQRSLAENTYAYAFPSTYLIPFLIEPFPTILAPLWLGRLIVRSHTEVQGVDAEEWLGMADMEMGRYADLLLNVILGVLIFYFPGGYTWMLFLGMAGSHVWIYAFDHYRVLRSIPACVFASYDIEWWAQAMLAPIIGVIASCWTFKSNCEPDMHCLRGPPLILTCCAAWLVHVVVHLLVLVYVVPLFGKTPPEEDPAKDVTFESLSKKLPCTWFTSNPVGCLRSRLFYSHAPACSYYIAGKEATMKPNPAIGCYYEAGSPKASASA